MNEALSKISRNINKPIINKLTWLRIILIKIRWSKFRVFVLVRNIKNIMFCASRRSLFCYDCDQRILRKNAGESTKLANDIKAVGGAYEIDQS